MAESATDHYDACARALEGAFLKSLPKSRKGLPSKEDWTGAMVGFNREARSLRDTYRLGYIGRAIVAYRFQRRMLEQGHPPEMVRHLIFSMVLNAFVG